jgi:hypothetical protein
MRASIVESTQRDSLSYDLRPIDDSDSKCLEEIRHVLQKHNCLGRFGVYLLHSPFHIGDDEILFETTDAGRRELLVRPVSKSFLVDYDIALQPTVIGFDEKGYHQICGCNAHSSDYPHHQLPGR